MAFELPFPGRRCKDCKKFGDAPTGHRNCSQDSFKRKMVYALDYACANFESRA